MPTISFASAREMSGKLCSNTPLGHFEHFTVISFLDDSKVAAPLMKLTSNSRPLTWTEEAGPAFTHLKGLLTTTPILLCPDPACQFMVEVDMSDMGVGIVLSQ